MDLESIYRLGLEHIKNIDLDSSDELYDPSTNNHIILLKLKKDIQIICPYISFLRYFGINTIWYLQFHLVCDKLESSFGFVAI